MRSRTRQHFRRLRRLRHLRFGALIILLALGTALATGCVSRVRDHEGERPPLWDFEPDVLIKNRAQVDGKGLFGRFLQAGGRVECSGWLFKKQTTHTYARMTAGRGGKPQKAPRITTKAMYLDGLFKHAVMSNTSKRKSSVETYETLSIGFNPGFQCSCVYVTATAPIPTGRTLIVTGEVCPEEG